MATKKSVSKGSRAGRLKAPGTKPSARSPAASAPVRRRTTAPRAFPVVGIGASAGGLEALEKFFAHAAAHDVQEPLGAVAGCVGLLEHRFPDKLDAKAREYIEGAAEGATSFFSLPN